MKRQKFSVLMSLYIKEKPEYFVQCMQSLLAQTVPADEIVIVKDGPLTQELEAVLQGYIERYPSLIKTVPLPENRGLGLALAAGVPACSYELIARMDTDDIARPDRFEKQLKAMEDQTIDIVGSQITEFEGSPDNIVSRRNVPLKDSDIKRYQRRRAGFNHVTVMFRKSAVLRAGNYRDCPSMEDDMMWVDMFNADCKGMNIDECLVNVRAGDELMKRRGSIDYVKKYYRGRKMIYDTGYITKWDLWYTVIAQFVVAVMPVSMRKAIFKKILRGG